VLDTETRAGGVGRAVSEKQIFPVGKGKKKRRKKKKERR
jgi:hypothetical protein